MASKTDEKKKTTTGTRWWESFDAATSTGRRTTGSGTASSGSGSTGNSGSGTGSTAARQAARKPTPKPQGSGLTVSFSQWQQNRQKAANQGRGGSLTDAQKKALASSVYNKLDREELLNQAQSQQRQLSDRLEQLRGGTEDTADFRRQLNDYARTLRQVNGWYNAVIWDEELYDSTKQSLQAMQDSYDAMFSEYEGLREDYNRQYQQPQAKRQTAALLPEQPNAQKLGLDGGQDMLQLYQLPGQLEQRERQSILQSGWDSYGEKYADATETDISDAITRQKRAMVGADEALRAQLQSEVDWLSAYLGEINAAAGADSVERTQAQQTGLRGVRAEQQSAQQDMQTAQDYMQIAQRLQTAGADPEAATDSELEQARQWLDSRGVPYDDTLAGIMEALNRQYTRAQNTYSRTTTAERGAVSAATDYAAYVRQLMEQHEGPETSEEWKQRYEDTAQTAKQSKWGVAGFLADRLELRENYERALYDERTQGEAQRVAQDDGLRGQWAEWQSASTELALAQELLDATRVRKSQGEDYLADDAAKGEAEAFLKNRGITTDGTDRGVSEAMQRWYDSTRATYDRLTGELEAAGYDTQSLEQYMQTVNNAEKTRQMQLESAQYAQEHPAAASAASVGANLFSGFGYLLDAVPARIQNLIAAAGSEMDGSGRLYQPIDVNRDAYAASNYTAAIRQTVAQNLAQRHQTIDPITGENAASETYQLGMSMADNVAQMLVGAAIMGGVPAGSAASGGASGAMAGVQSAIAAAEPITLAIMGTGAATSQLVEDINSGMNEADAFAIGTMAGLIEIATEKMGIDAMLGDPSNLWQYISKNMLSEGMEEGLSEIGNELVNLIALQDESDRAQAIRAYVAQGYTEAEAAGLYTHDLLARTLGASLGGAISGGIFGGTGAAIQTIGGMYDNATGGRPAWQSVAPAQAEAGQRAQKAAAQKAAAQTGRAQVPAKPGESQTGTEGALRQTAQRRGYDTESQTLARTALETRPQDVSEARYMQQWDAARSYGLEGVSLEYAKRSGATENLSEAAMEAAYADGVRVAGQSGTAWAREASRMGEAGAKQLGRLLEQTGDSQNAAALRSGFSAYYRAGLSGSDMSRVQGGQLSRSQQKIAYQAGVQDAARSLARERSGAGQAQVAGKDSGLVYDAYVLRAMQTGSAETGSGTRLTKQTAQLLDQAARALGVRVRFVDSVAGGKANAAISGSTVLVERGNPNPVRFLLGHELTHRMQELAPEQYRSFRNAVAQEAGHDVDAKLELYARHGETLSYEGAMDEAAADYAGRLMEGGAVLDEFIERHRTDRTLLERLRDAIRSLIGKLTGEEKRMAQTAEGKLTAALEAAAEQAQRLESKNTAQEGGAVRYSAKAQAGYDYSKPFSEQIEDWIAGEIPRNDTLVVGPTPEVFKRIGMAALPVTINKTHIDYALNGTKDFDHALGKDLLKQLPQAIRQPVAIMTSGTKSGSSVVAMLEIRHNGKQVVAPVVVGGFGTQNGIQIDSNAITSLYGKKYSISKVLQNAIAQETNGQFRLYYIDKKKATALLQVARVPMPKMPASNNGLIHTLSDPMSPVNTKISDVTESQQFKRWFGDWQNNPGSASKVVNDDGTPRVVYHGTNQYFYTFRSKNGTYWFSESVDYAESMMEERDGDRVVKAYLNIKNPLYVNLEPGQFSDPTYEAKYIRQAKKAGNDGVVFMLNTGNQLVDDTFYVAFKPEQIKSADENIGTFDKTNPDIRYSRKGTSIDQTYEQLLQENERLRERVEYWKGQTKRTASATTDRNAVARQARELIRSYGAQLQTEDIRPQLQSLYDFMASGRDGGDELSYGAARQRAEEIAGKLVDSALEQDDELYRSYKDLRDYLRATELTISEADSRDIPDFQDFRRRNFGRMKLRRGAGNVDRVYQELEERWPEFFSEKEQSAPSDQVQHIAEVMERIYRVTERNPFSGYSSQAVAGIANEILDNFFELPQTRATFADRQAQRLDAAKAKGKEQLQRAREQTREQKQELTRQRREAVQRAILGEKMAAGKQLEKLKREYQAKGKEQRESQQRRELAARITRHAKALGQKLLRPTDTGHIPEKLRTAVAQVLQSINLESGRDYDRGLTGPEATKRTQAWMELRKQYQRAAEDESTGMVVDPAMFGAGEDGRSLFDKAQAAAMTPVSRRSVQELEDLWQLVRAVEHSVSTAGKVLSRGKYARTAQWAEAMVQDTQTRMGRRRNLAYDMETPYTFFSHYGQAGMAVYRMLRDAQDQRQLYASQVMEQVGEIVSPAQVQKWQKERHTFQTQRGEELTLTTAQIMELRELMNRPQAAEHIRKGGIMQPEIKGGGRRIARGTDAVLLSQEDVAQILGKLNKEQISAADRMQQIMSGTLARMGNQASMAAYGYRKFTERSYWPIQTAKEQVHSRTEQNAGNTRSIKNIGMAQSTVAHASNAVELPGLFDTFARHSADMMDYAAWLLPMEDANRLYNFQFRDADGNRTGKTIKGLLDRIGGPGGQQYWSRLMEDIQNGIAARQDSEWAQGAQRVIGNAKGAAVGGNMRVVIQQPTAFLRAGAVMSPADLSRGLVRGVTPGNGWKKALQWAPIAQIKDAGSFDIGSEQTMRAQLFGDETRLERFNDAMGWGAGKADAMTWGKLWNACEHEVARKQKGVAPGSDAFYRATAKRFTEVIDATQVVDGVLQRSQIMRSGNMLNKMATAFMGEPTMSLNLLMRSANDFLYENDKAKRNKARGKIGRAAAALLVTDVINALAQSLIDALRDDDRDKDYWARYWAALTGQTGDEEGMLQRVGAFFLNGNIGSNMDPIERLPYAKDLKSIWQGYDVTRADADVIADIVNAAKTAAASLDGNGTKTRAYAIEQLAKNVGKLFGVSAGNLLRDAFAVVRSIAIESGSIPVQYELEKLIYNYTSDNNTSRYMDLLFDAARQEDTDSYEHIRTELLEGGAADEDKLTSGMKSRIRTHYEGGELDGAQALSMLQTYCGLDEDEAADMILTWQFKQEQGYSYSELKDKLLEGAVSAEDVVRYRMEYGGATEEQAEQTVSQWRSELETGVDYSEVKELYLAGTMSREEAIENRVQYGGQTQREAEQTLLDWDVEAVRASYDADEITEEQARGRLQALGFDADEAEDKTTDWRQVKQTGSSSIWSDYMLGKISREDAIAWRVEYDGKTVQEATAEADARDFKLEHPEYEDYTDTQVGKYLDLAEPAGVSVGTYFSFLDEMAQLHTDKDADGKNIAGQTRKDKGMAYINSLPISSAQKDALYLTQWKQSTIGDAPWH